MEMELQASDKERFEAFLTSKNIDSELLKDSEFSLYERWFCLFSQIHEESFVMQLKFKINPIRRKYPKTRFVA